MLKDITIGQFFPGKSLIHRIDPRMKILLVIFYIVMLFLSGNYYSLTLSAAFIFLCYLLSGIPIKMIFKSLKPVLPIILMTAALNMLFVEGDVLFSFWFVRITTQGITIAITMAVRIICLIAGTSLLTYSTSPISLTDGIERLLSPLRRFGFPAHELAMMMTIALRFIPTLIEETDKIMNAQKARGADLETGGLIQRVRALVPILIPLFVSAFRRADELALAMECRCYRGGEGRTRMKQLKMAMLDYVSAASVCLGIASVIVINIFFPVLFK